MKVSKTNTAVGLLWYSLLFLLALSRTTSAAVKPIIAQGSSIDLSENLYFYEDAYNILSIESLLKTEFTSFKRLDTTEITMDFTFNSLWFGFSLKNEQESDTTYFLYIDNPDLNTVSYYETDGVNLLREVHTGERQAFAERDVLHRNFVFKLTLASKTTRTYYLKINNNGEAAVFSLNLKTPEAFVAGDSRSDITVLAYGAIAFLVVLALFLFIVLKSSIYFLYGIFVLSSVLSLANLHGYPALHFWPNSPWFTDYSGTIFSFIANFTMLLFVQRFLDLRTHRRGLYRITNVYLAIIAFFIVISFVPSPYVIVSHIGNNFLTLLTFILVPSCAIVSLKTNRLRAIYVLTSYTPLAAAVVVYFLRVTGAFGGQPPVVWMDLGLTFQLLVLSFGLIDSFRHEQANMITKLAA
jgi:hypothetical protein